MKVDGENSRKRRKVERSGFKAREMTKEQTKPYSAPLHVGCSRRPFTKRFIQRNKNEANL